MAIGWRYHQPGLRTGRQIGPAYVAHLEPVVSFVSLENPRGTLLGALSPTGQPAAVLIHAGRPAGTLIHAGTAAATGAHRGSESFSDRRTGTVVEA